MPSHDELVQEVGRFAERELDDELIEREGLISAELIDKMRGMGLFGLTIAEEHGGLGLPLSRACAIVRELARFDRSVATLVGLHAGLGTHAIASHGTDEIRREWLPRMASGEVIGAFAATEPMAGSDIASVHTRAVADGDRLVLTGEKSYVTNARHAGCFTVLARYNAQGHVLVLVPRDAAGVSIGPEEHKLGIRASSTAPLFLDGVRVPRGNVLGAAGAGLETAYETLMRGRLLMSAGCVGTAQAALDRTVDHVTRRKQFRRAVSDFPAVRLRMTELAALVFAMDALVQKTAVRLDEHASVATKIFASEGAFEVCDAAIQLHGALGVMEPIGVCRLLRDCRVTRIFEGANDVLLVRLGMAILSTKRRASYAHPACAELGARLAGALDQAQKRLGATVVQRQTLVQELARVEIALRAAEACAASAGSSRLAAFATEHWIRVGSTRLDALASREDAESRALEISRDVYGVSHSSAAE